MSIEIVIQKGVIYSIASLAIIGSYSIIVVISEQYLRGMIGYSSTIITAIAVFIIAAAFQPLIRFLQNWTDQRFFRQRYDYQTALRNLSRDILTKIKLEDLVSLIVSSFIDILKVSEVSFLMLDKKTGKYHTSEMEFPLPDDLISRLKETRRVLSVDNKLLIPVALRDELTAVIALGEKLSGDVYSDEDLRLLNTIANQTALALDNIRLYNEIRQSDKLKALGIMSAGMAHEIKNPLSALRLMTQLLPQKYDDPEFRSKMLEIFPHEVARIDRIVEGLMQFNRSPETSPHPINLNRLIEKVLDNFRFKLVEQKIETIKKMREIPELIADAGQISQVFSNLILNAIQAMSNGGKLTIETFPAESGVVIRVADTGGGILPEDQLNLFDPFFTTKHEGSGLGLFIAASIVNSHNGRIKVDSEVGKGTVFEVYLPV